MVRRIQRRFRLAAVALAVVVMTTAGVAVAIAQGSTPDWQTVQATAHERSGDLALSNAIADDVAGRGTVWLFMTGRDPGVLYGVSESAIKPVVTTRTVTRTVRVPGPTTVVSTESELRVLFAPNDVKKLMAAVDDVGVYVAKVDKLDLEFPKVTRPAGLDASYKEIDYTFGGLPVGVTVDGVHKLTGIPTEAGTYRVTFTAKMDAIDLPQIEETLAITLNVVANTKPAFSTTIATLISVTRGQFYPSISLPLASGGNGDITYAIEEKDKNVLPKGLSFERSGPFLTGTVDNEATPGVTSVTLTAVDSDDDESVTDKGAIIVLLRVVAKA